MSRVVIMGVSSHACAMALLSVCPRMDIILIDDSRESGAKIVPPNPVTALQAFHDGLQIASSSDYPITSNRKERKQNQPFYRGLKKYRKP